MTSAEKSMVRQILQSPGWRIIEDMAKEIIQKTRDQSNLRETEWETIKSVAVEEGQIQGINLLIQEIYKTAQDA